MDKFAKLDTQALFKKNESKALRNLGALTARKELKKGNFSVIENSLFSGFENSTKLVSKIFESISEADFLKTPGYSNSESIFLEKTKILINIFNKNCEEFFKHDKKQFLGALHTVFVKLLPLGEDLKYLKYFWNSLHSKTQSFIGIEYFDKFSSLNKEVSNLGISTGYFTKENLDSDFIRTSIYGNCNVNLLESSKNVYGKEFEPLKADTIMTLSKIRMNKYAETLLSHSSVDAVLIKKMSENGVSPWILSKYDPSLMSGIGLKDLDASVKIFEKNYLNSSDPSGWILKFNESLKSNLVKNNFLKNTDPYGIFGLDATIPYDEPKTGEDFVFSAVKKFKETGDVSYLSYAVKSVTDRVKLTKTPFDETILKLIKDSGKYVPDSFFKNLGQAFSISGQIATLDPSIWLQKENINAIKTAINDESGLGKILVKKLKSYIVNNRNDEILSSLIKSLTEGAITNHGVETALKLSNLVVGSVFSCGQYSTAYSCNNNTCINQDICVNAFKIAESNGFFTEIENSLGEWSGAIPFSGKFHERLISRPKFLKLFLVDDLKNLKGIETSQLNSFCGVHPDEMPKILNSILDKIPDGGDSFTVVTNLDSFISNYLFRKKELSWRTEYYYKAFNEKPEEIKNFIDELQDSIAFSIINKFIIPEISTVNGSAKLLSILEEGWGKIAFKYLDEVNGNTPYFLRTLPTDKTKGGLFYSIFKKMDMNELFRDDLPKTVITNAISVAKRILNKTVKSAESEGQSNYPKKRLEVNTAFATYLKKIGAYEEISVKITSARKSVNSLSSIGKRKILKEIGFV